MAFYENTLVTRQDLAEKELLSIKEKHNKLINESSGKVVKVVDFGAFVNFFGKRDGLVHISQLANERVKSVTDIVSEGDIVKVKLLGFDNRGKVKLSMKEVDQKTGKEIISESEKISEEPPKEKKSKKAKKTKKAKEEDSD